MIPPVADFLYTQITGAVGIADIWTETLSTGLSGYSPEVTQYLVDNGVMWTGVPAVKAGAVIIGYYSWNNGCLYYDKRLDKVGITALFVQP